MTIRDNNGVRLALLLMAGGLLIGAGTYWSLSSKEREVNELPSKPIQRAVSSSRARQIAKPPMKSVEILEPTFSLLPERKADDGKESASQQIIRARHALWENDQKNAVVDFLFQNQSTLRVLAKPNFSAETQRQDIPEKPTAPMTRDAAEIQARLVSSGTTDPYVPIPTFKLRDLITETRRDPPVDNQMIRELFTNATSTKPKKLRIPPPPSPVLPSFLVPPPPPVVSMPTSDGSMGEQDQLGMPMEQLPSPPEPPSIVKYFTLTGVIGDRAIFSLDKEFAVQHDLSKTITLGVNEELEDLKLVSINGNKVLIEEHGIIHQKEI